MEQSQEIQKRIQSFVPAKIQEALVEIDTVATDYGAMVRADDGTPSSTIVQAYAMQKLRDLLTPDIMAPIMGLQGTKLGFVTDKDKARTKGADGRNKYGKGPGYPVEVVRDVTIWAWGQGAAMTGNQVNIISDNGYLAKGFFFSALDDRLGPGNWKFVHNVPHTSGAGALVSSRVDWTVDGKKNSETLEHGIKGDDYSSTDQYIGKADRKCGKWLLERLSNRRYSDGEAENPLSDGAINVTADSVEDSGEPTKADNFMADMRKAAEVEPEATKPPETATPKAKPEPEVVVDEKPKAVVEEAPQIKYPSAAALVKALNAPQPVVLQFFRAFAADSPYHVDAKKGLGDLDKEVRKEVMDNAETWQATMKAWADPKK